MENGHGISGFTHKTWWFSIAMLNSQRVGHQRDWIGSDVSSTPGETIGKPGKPVGNGTFIENSCNELNS